MRSNFIDETFILAYTDGDYLMILRHSPFTLRILAREIAETLLAMPESSEISEVLPVIWASYTTKTSRELGEK